MACFGVNILHIYPLIHVLSPHPCFIPPSVFYPLIRVLSPYPCFIPSSVFYLLTRVLSPHPYPYPCFIPTFSIPCNAELKARLIVSVDRDARFCALELLVILLVDANSRKLPQKR